MALPLDKGTDETSVTLLKQRHGVFEEAAHKSVVRRLAGHIARRAFLYVLPMYAIGVMAPRAASAQGLSMVPGSGSAAVGFVAGVSPQNQVAGIQATFTVSKANVAAMPTYDANFNIALGSAFTAAAKTGTCAAHDTSTTVSKTCVFVGFNPLQTPFGNANQIGSGAAFTITITPPTGAKPTSFPLQISNIGSVSPTGSKVVMTSSIIATVKANAMPSREVSMASPNNDPAGQTHVAESGTISFALQGRDIVGSALGMFGAVSFDPTTGNVQAEPLSVPGDERAVAFVPEPAGDSALTPTGSRTYFSDDKTGAVTALDREFGQQIGLGKWSGSLHFSSPSDRLVSAAGTKDNGYLLLYNNPADGTWGLETADSGNIPMTGVGLARFKPYSLTTPEGRTLDFTPSEIRETANGFTLKGDSGGAIMMLNIRRDTVTNLFNGSGHLPESVSVAYVSPVRGWMPVTSGGIAVVDDTAAIVYKSNISDRSDVSERILIRLFRQAQGQDEMLAAPSPIADQVYDVPRGAEITLGYQGGALRVVAKPPGSQETTILTIDPTTLKLVGEPKRVPSAHLPAGGGLVPFASLRMDKMSAEGATRAGVPPKRYILSLAV